jgi:hypothetical protein
MRKLLRELEKEREILCRLAVQEINRNGNRTLSDAVIAQSQKVDTLLLASGGMKARKKRSKAPHAPRRPKV